jgi:hypothetical protein
MKTRTFLFYLLAILLGGCLPVMSLHPLYSEKNVVFDEKLLGTWVDDPNKPETTWQFSRGYAADAPETEKQYKLIFCDKEGKKGSFEAHLVKLNKQLFLDVYPSELPWEPNDPNKVQWAYNTLFLIPAHGFLKVNAAEPQLKLQIVLSDKCKEFLEKDPNAVERTIVEDRVVLTAQTKKLQEFFGKYGDAEIYGDELVLTRQPAHKTQK